MAINFPSTLGQPTNGSYTYTEAGITYSWNGSSWQASSGSGGGGANVTISDTIPAGSPAAGDLWWESDSGRLKIYYTDVDSSQWVDTNPALAPSFALGDLSVTTASAGTPALSYNNGTGVFTYTPPDLSSFITQQYSLPTSSTTVLGGVKVDGSTITIDGNGVISGSSSYSLPTATTTVLGGVKVDGTTITINNGVISGASSVPSTINISSETTDTTCFPVFTTTSTSGVGGLGLKTASTSFKFNSSTGELEAGSFKKVGGTSSQFLKADGSVDSTTYSTFSGSYNNLTNRPTIPTLTSQLTNDSGFLTTATPTRVWILDDESISAWGATKLVTGIPTGGAGGTTGYKRITILLNGVALINPGSGQIRIRLGTSNNGISNQYYNSASTDGQGNTYTASDCFIIGKTVSRGAGPLLSGSIVLDRSGGGASGGSFGDIVQTHTVLEHGTGTDHIYSGGGIKEVFQADNFDRLEFTVDNSQTGGSGPSLTGSFSFGNVSIYVEF